MSLFPELHFVLDFIVFGIMISGASNLLCLVYFILIMSTRIAFFIYYC